MFKLLFSSRWLALVWGAGMVGSAAMFVGEDGAVEQIGKTVEQVAAQQRELAEAQAVVSEPEPEEPIVPPAFADADFPADGELFVNPETGQQIRIVRRAVTVDYAAQPTIE